MLPQVSIIVSITQESRAIGKKSGELLFRISDDLKRFKTLTTGHPIIMGRRTHESIGRPLPDRTNIVITRNLDYKTEGCVVVQSIEEALARAREVDNEKIFIIGGGEIYKQALPHTDKLYLTIVESDMSGDVFFPEYEKDFTKETYREERFDEKTGLKYAWVDLER